LLYVRSTWLACLTSVNVHDSKGCL